MERLSVVTVPKRQDANMDDCDTDRGLGLITVHRG